MTVDPIAFRAFEAAAWDPIPDPYERFFGPITARAIDPLLDAVHLRAGQRLLDVATGTGHIAGRAAARGALATGLDLAAGMVTTASRNYPSVRFDISAAEELPFASGAFDAAVSGFGLGHFAEPTRVVTELARVVAPGGRMALSWWDEPSRARVLGVFHDALTRAEAPPADLPPGLPFFHYSSEPELRALLEDGGLLAIGFRRLSFLHHLSSPDALWNGVLAGSVRTSAAILGQPTEMQRTVRAAFDALVLPHRTGEALEIPVAMIVAYGVVPT